MSIASLYLVLYNIIQFFGWCYLLVISALHLIQKRQIDGLWYEIALPLKIFQTWMAVEVLHSMCRLVRSSPVTTLVQIASRVFIVWLVFDSVPVTRVRPGLALCALAWSLAESSRYLYYVLSSSGSVPGVVVWFRYSLFLVLYPVGVLGEMLSVFASLPAYKNSVISIAGISVSVYHLLVCTLVIYIPGLVVMYRHMLLQRSKVLSPKTTGTRKKTH